MTKLILKCECGKIIGTFTRYELIEFLKAKRMNLKRIKNTVNKLEIINSKYDICCGDIVIIQEDINSTSTVKMTDELNNDARKEQVTIDHMVDLYDGYSEHWNNDNSISNYED